MEDCDDQETSGESQDVRTSRRAQGGEEDIFRQYFESRFEPLQEVHTTANEPWKSRDHSGAPSDTASLPDWEGLSVDDSSPPVEVIEYEEKVGTRTNDLHDAKAFMGAKPPGLDGRIVINDGEKDQHKKESAAESINLKHDLELQRLLKESHLLDGSSGPLTHTQRHKAIDLRMQSLGAKTSLFTQAKMPLSHRRGIIAKAAQKEAKRRKEAKENGIILEKEARQRHVKSVKRDRGVGGPTVGKFKNGELKLSRRDIRDIQGSERSRTNSVSRKRRK